MADRRHAVTQLDFFIRQVTLFADEVWHSGRRKRLRPLHGESNFCLWLPIAFVLPESKHPRPVRTQEVCCQNCAYGTAMQMPDNPASCVHFGQFKEP